MAEIPLANLTFVYFVHPINALLSTFVIFLPIVTLTSFLLFLNAFLPIETTLKVFSLILIAAGIVILFIFFFALLSETLPSDVIL